MLQIKDVKKVYKTGSLVQRALDGVRLSLRDNEFVAILGPSGSGKTTLLNVIGGLDRYDSGELIINGVSTRKYSARDWDSYRNHTVGFVFQSYNLIPHQSVLSNVELALTISGVSPAERRRRAREALVQVGLADHLHKKPAQLSGGQMQRVAIARALVNDPDILLADEPTGALDSETSVQVMELLKQVASDRLVVMVTHNPELAEQYATRIVRLRDGRITDDTDPYDPEAEGSAVHRNLGRASMSVLTALTLSFNNLWTKKVRTLLVAFAGSIGIIGIALILSMSNGVNRYIQSVEEDTLKSYPLQITDSSFDLSTLLSRGNGNRSQTDQEAAEDAEVREWKTVTNLFSRVSVNDLSALRAWLESGETDIYDHVQAITYEYNITPRIYAVDGQQVRQVNPDTTFSSMGISSGEGLSSMLSSLTSSDSFRVMPSEPALYEEQYDVMAGHWPEDWNECVVVLTKGGWIPDLTLYALGLKDPAELEELVRRFAQGETVTATGPGLRLAYTDLLGISFKVLPGSALYSYDAEYAVWADRSGDEAWLRQVLETAGELTVVGVVQPREDAGTATLSYGIAYPAALEDHLRALSADSEVTRSQLARREIDVFTGLPFGESAQGRDMDLSSLFTVDQEAIANAFQFDLGEGGLGLDLSDLDLSGLDLSGLGVSGSLDSSALLAAMPGLSQSDLADLMSGVKLNLNAEDLRDLFARLLEGWLLEAAADPATDPTRLPEALRDYLSTGAARALLEEGVRQALADNGAALVTAEELESMLVAVLAGYEDYAAERDPEGTALPLAYLNDYLQTDAAQAALEAAVLELQTRTEAFVLTPEQIAALALSVYEDYETYAAENGAPGLKALLTSFTDYLSSEEAAALLTQAVTRAVDTSGLQAKANALISRYAASVSAAIGRLMERAMAGLTAQLARTITDNLAAMTEQLAANLQEAFTIDPEALAEAFRMNMDAGELRDLMTALMSKQTNTYAGNLRKLSFARDEDPASITIYPRDFEGKSRIKALLADYNARMEQEDPDKVITYTDIVDTLMSSVTLIVDAISAVLIGFVAVSLVVSSVMIGVITYISVLERRKEIGILRAIGASRRNVSQVFNAETFIIGALAGLLGVGLSYLALVPINNIIAAVSEGVNIRAYLPPDNAAILVALSIVLTLLGGLIPSRKAARQDPVTALRSE